MMKAREDLILIKQNICTKKLSQIISDDTYF